MPSHRQIPVVAPATQKPNRSVRNLRHYPSYSAISIDPTMKVPTATRTRECDGRASAEFKVPSLTLVEDAGAATARYAVTRYASVVQLPSAALLGESLFHRHR
jgi:hypothetical protein